MPGCALRRALLSVLLLGAAALSGACRSARPALEEERAAGGLSEASDTAETVRTAHALDPLLATGPKIILPVEVLARGTASRPADAKSEAQGRILAERAARLNAMGSLLDALTELPDGVGEQIAVFLDAHPEAVTCLQGAAPRGASERGRQYLADGAVEIVLAIPGEMIAPCLR